MDDNEYTLYRKQLVENEQAKVREDNVFNEYESETLEGNKDLVFVKNLVELDFENEFQDQQIDVVRSSYYTANQLAQVHDNTKRLMSDDVAIKHRSEKNRKRRAKDAKKNAKKAHELLLENMGEQSEVDKYKTNTKLNELHLNMNMNRAKAIAKNKEDEERLIARARRAFLVREMENTAKAIASGQLDAKEMKAASKSCYAATIEYIDVLVKSGELTAENATKVKSSSAHLANFVYKKVLKGVCKVENVSYVNYFTSLEKDISKNQPTDEQKLKADFEVYKTTSGYKSDQKFNSPYNLDGNSYKIRYKLSSTEKLLKHYVSQELKEKYAANLNSQPGATDLYALGNDNRMIGRILRYVEFDAFDEPLEEYKEADKWNRQYLESITFDITDKSKESIDKAVEKRIPWIKEMITALSTYEELYAHIDDDNWVIENIEYISWYYSVSLCFYSNLVKGDPINKQAYDKVFEEDTKLKELYEKNEKFSVPLAYLLNMRLTEMGVDPNSIYANYQTDAQRKSAKESIDSVKMQMEALKTMNLEDIGNK